MFRWRMLLWEIGLHYLLQRSSTSVPLHNSCPNFLIFDFIRVITHSQINQTGYPLYGYTFIIRLCSISIHSCSEFPADSPITTYFVSSSLIVRPLLLTSRWGCDFYRYINIDNDISIYQITTLDRQMIYQNIDIWVICYDISIYR